MPDLNYAINQHVNDMRGWWRRKEYIKERKNFILHHPFCDRCGRVATTPGHSREDYKDFETYLNAVKTGKCDALCSACNREERRNRRPCPICSALYKMDHNHKIHYITLEQDHCWSCDPHYNPDQSRLKHQFNKQVRQALGRESYNRAHPMVKVPVNGTWKKVPR